MTSIDYQMLDNSRLKLVISGRLDAESTSRLWSQALGKVGQTKPQMLVVDATSVDYCDGAGMALLLQLQAAQQRSSGRIQIKGLRREFKQLLALFDPGKVLLRRFFGEAGGHLRPGGYVQMVYSSIAWLGEALAIAEELGWEAREVARRRVFGETLAVYRLTPVGS